MFDSERAGTVLSVRRGIHSVRSVRSVCSVCSMHGMRSVMGCRVGIGSGGRWSVVNDLSAEDDAGTVHLAKVKQSNEGIHGDRTE